MALPSDPGFQDLMAYVGHFLLRWGWLEDRLGDRPVPPELDGVRRMRNLIAHSMCAAHADPDQGRLPYIVCRNGEDGLIEFSIEQIDDAIRDLERIGGPMRRD